MAKNITKRDLVLDIADGNSIPQATIQQVVESFLNLVKFHMEKGQTIEIRGFGTFSLKTRKGRVARNPRTGSKVVIATHLAPHLRFCEEFRKKVGNNGEL